MFKQIISVLMIFSCLINIAACSPFVVWKEEVKLNDGRVILVQQKKREEGRISREAWLTIDLPEFSQRPMVWHENLTPLIVNVYNGRLFVVGWPPTDIEKDQYGDQKPPYIGYVWEKGAFVRIPFEQIPEKIYDTNMLIDDFPPNGTNVLTLEEKYGLTLNGRGTLPLFYKRIKPTLGCLCQMPRSN